MKKHKFLHYITFLLLLITKFQNKIQVLSTVVLSDAKGSI